MFTAVKTRILILLLCLVFIPFDLSPATPSGFDLLHHRWPADWIACPGAPAQGFGVYYFRKDFSLSRKPGRFVINASGDNRYELFVNGVRVLEGPARGDVFHWPYATLDIAKYLHPGKNVLAAVVWNYGELAPMAQMSNRTGLIIQGNSEREAIVDTNSSWRCLRGRALQMIPINRKRIPFYCVVGPGERWDGSQMPWGWQDSGYDDSGWKPAASLGYGGPRGIQDSHSAWLLVPRTIPLMEDKPQPMVRVVRSKGVQARQAFCRVTHPLPFPRTPPPRCCWTKPTKQPPIRNSWSAADKGSHHSDLCRSALEEWQKRQPEHHSRQKDAGIEDRVSSGRRQGADVPAALVANLPLSASRGQDRRGAPDPGRPSRNLHSVSL